jgi:hypothetical protein
VKFLSRVLTALNLLPSIATLDVASRPICEMQRLAAVEKIMLASPDQQISSGPGGVMGGNM